MADAKISALPSSTTPLAGTEVVPLVQSGVTKKVTVADLTAGRSVSMLGLTLTGGTATGVAFLNASKVVTTGTDLVFDSANIRLGIGVASPAATLDALGVVRISANASGNASLTANATTGAAAYAMITTSRYWRFLTTNSDTKLKLNDESAGATRLTVDTSGNFGFLTDTPTAVVDVNGSTIRVRTARTPASATATGNAGDICWDASYVYVCTAANTWKRVAIATW